MLLLMSLVHAIDTQDTTRSGCCSFDNCNSCSKTTRCNSSPGYCIGCTKGYAVGKWCKDATELDQNQQHQAVVGHVTAEQGLLQQILEFLGIRNNKPSQSNQNKQQARNNRLQRDYNRQQSTQNDSEEISTSTMLIASTAIIGGILITYMRDGTVQWQPEYFITLVKWSIILYYTLVLFFSKSTNLDPNGDGISTLSDITSLQSSYSMGLALFILFALPVTVVINEIRKSKKKHPSTKWIKYLNRIKWKIIRWFGTYLLLIIYFEISGHYSRIHLIPRVSSTAVIAIIFPTSFFPYDISTSFPEPTKSFLFRAIYWWNYDCREKNQRMSLFFLASRYHDFVVDLLTGIFCIYGVGYNYDWINLCVTMVLVFFVRMLSHAVLTKSLHFQKFPMNAIIWPFISWFRYWRLIIYNKGMITLKKKCEGKPTFKDGVVLHSAGNGAIVLKVGKSNKWFTVHFSEAPSDQSYPRVYLQFEENCAKVCTITKKLGKKETSKCWGKFSDFKMSNIKDKEIWILIRTSENKFSSKLSLGFGSSPGHNTSSSKKYETKVKIDASLKYIGFANKNAYSKLKLIKMTNNKIKKGNVIHSPSVFEAGAECDPNDPMFKKFIKKIKNAKASKHYPEHIKSYTGSGYKHYNRDSGLMKKDLTKINTKMANDIRGLALEIRKHGKIKVSNKMHNQIVWRGVNLRTKEKMKIAKETFLKLIGKEFVWWYFVSTSTEGQFGANWAGGGDSGNYSLFFSIHTKDKGLQAYVDDISTCSGENECLLAAGSCFKVCQVIDFGPSIIVHLDLIKNYLKL